MTGKADDLQSRFQNFKIVDWRYPAQRFSLNHYPILEQAFMAWNIMMMAFFTLLFLHWKCLLLKKKLNQKTPNTLLY